LQVKNYDVLFVYVVSMKQRMKFKNLISTVLLEADKETYSQILLFCL